MFGVFAKYMRNHLHLIYKAINNCDWEVVITNKRHL